MNEYTKDLKELKERIDCSMHLESSDQLRGGKELCLEVLDLL